MNKETKVKEFSNYYNLNAGFVETISDKNRLKTVIENITADGNINIEVTRFIYNVDYYKELDQKLETTRKQLTLIEDYKKREKHSLTIHELEEEVKKYKVDILNTASSLYEARSTENLQKTKKYFFSGKIKQAFHSLNVNSLTETQKGFNKILSTQKILDEEYVSVVDNASEFQVKAQLNLINSEILSTQKKLDEVYEKLVDNASEFEVKARLTLINLEIDNSENRFRKAIEFFDLGKISALKSRKSELISRYIWNYAIEAKDHNYFEKAESLFLEALETSQNSNQDSRESIGFRLTTSAALADLYIAQNELSKAEKVYKQELLAFNELYKDNPEIPSDKAILLNNMGRLYFNKKEYTKAIHAHNESLEIIRPFVEKEPKKHMHSFGIYLYNIGLVLSQSGEIDLALKNYEHALKCFEYCYENKTEGLILQDFVKVWSSIGYIYSQKNNLEKSLQYHFKSIESIKKAAKDNPRVFSPQLAHTLNDLGNTYLDQDENIEYLTEAAKYFKESLEIRRKLHHEFPHAYLPHIAMSLNNLAAAYTKLGKFNEALQNHQESLNIREKLSISSTVYLPDLAMSYLNMGSLFSYQNNLDQSIEYFEKSLHIYIKLSGTEPSAYKLFVADVLQNLGVVHLERNDFRNSISYLNQSIEIRKELLQTQSDLIFPRLISTFDSLTQVYLETDELDEAICTNLESLELQRKYNQTSINEISIEKAVHFQKLGPTFGRSGKFEIAIRCYSQSVFIFNRLIIEDPASNYQLYLALSLSEMGFTYVQLEQFDNAEEAYHNSLLIHRKFIATSVQNSVHLATLLTNLVLFYLKSKPDSEKPVSYAQELYQYTQDFPQMNEYKSQAVSLVELANQNFEH